MDPRGIRNKNPGNIRHGDNWRGMAPEQTDDDFIQFISPEYGFRAMTRVLRNYQRRHGLETIEEIISRWAPPEDNNDTRAYIEHVAEVTGLDPQQRIDVDDHMPALLAAITLHENGQQPYSANTIRQGIALA